MCDLDGAQPPAPSLPGGHDQRYRAQQLRRDLGALPSASLGLSFLDETPPGAQATSPDALRDACPAMEGMAAPFPMPTAPSARHVGHAAAVAPLAPMISALRQLFAAEEATKRTVVATLAAIATLDLCPGALALRFLTALEEGADQALPLPPGQPGGRTTGLAGPLAELAAAILGRPAVPDQVARLQATAAELAATIRQLLSLPEPDALSRAAGMPEGVARPAGDEYYVTAPQFLAFVDTVVRTVERYPDPEAAIAELRAPFSELLWSDGWLPEAYAAPAPVSGMGGGIGSYLLFRNAARTLSISSLVVPAGAATPVHDHLGWGLVGLHRGEQYEEVFRRFDAGEAEGQADLGLAERRFLRRGDFYDLIPPTGDIHRVVAAATAPSVSIHLLRNDVGCVDRHAFDPDAHTVRPFRSGYVNTDCGDEPIRRPPLLPC